MAGRRDIFEQAMREGNSAAWDQEWTKAISAYTRALKEYPEDTTALNSIGLALIQTNRHKEALAAYSRAAKIEPNDLVAVENMADLLERLGRLDEAANAFLAAAEIHIQHQSIDKAISKWQRAVALNPSLVQAHTRLAAAYERLGQTRLAIMEYLAVARIMQKRSDFGRAVQAAERAQKLDPGNAEVLDALDRLRTGGELSDSLVQRVRPSLTGSDEDTVDAFVSPSEMGDSGSGSEVEVSARDNPLRTGVNQAVELLANAIFEIDGEGTGTNPLVGLRGDRTKVVTHLGRALDAQLREDYAEAAEAYDKAIKAGLDHPSAQLILGNIRLEAEDYKNAIKRFTAAAPHPNYTAAAQYGLGLAYGRTEKFREAAGHLLQALRVLDLNTVSSSHRAELNVRYEQLINRVNDDMEEDEVEELAFRLVTFMIGADWQDRLQRARRQLDSQSDRLMPLADLLSIAGAEHVFTSMDLIEQYINQGYLDPAIEEAYYAISMAPSYLPLHIKLAELFEKDGRPQEAIRKYSVVADLYQARGEGAKAGEIMTTMVRLAPMDLGVRGKLVELFVAQGETDKALDQYMDIADVYYRLADLDRCRDTYADALRLAQRSHVDHHWTLKILHRMGDIDIQRLDWRQAQRVYEQIKTLAPNDVKARSSLIELYLKSGQTRQAHDEIDTLLRGWLGARQPQPAIDLLERLVIAYPDDMGIRTRLAQLYQQLKRKADAIKHLDALGELQIEAGLKREAIQTVLLMMKLDPENTPQYQEVIAELRAQG